MIESPGLVTPSGKPLSTVDEYNARSIKIPNVEVVGPRLLVLPPAARERRSEGGVIIPESARDTAREALVLIVGDPVMLADGTFLPQRYEPGQVIIYAPYAGIELEMDGVTYLLIQQSDVRVVLTYKGIGLRVEE